MSWQSTPGWHLDDASLEAYVGGSRLSVVGPSVEVHLLDCSGCRARLGELVPDEAVTRAWTAIRAPVEAPRAGVVERVMRRLGVREGPARLLAAVPAFRGSWLLGLFVATLFSGIAAVFAGEFGMALFLIVAPLAPVAGVALSFGGEADPAHELVTVTPHSALRLLLLRTAGVLVTSLPVAALAGMVLPGPPWLAVAWLTPALAGVTLTLALAPLFGATATAATICACWSGCVVAAQQMTDPAAAVAPTMQVVLLLLTLVALLTLVVRYPSLDLMERQS